MIHTESLMAPGIECAKQEKPEGGVPCQVPDSPVPCDEEAEREKEREVFDR